jgi:hypothetical protein
MNTQLETLRAAMIEDYNVFVPKDTEFQQRMRTEFADGIQFKEGKKYIKVTTGNAPGDHPRVWGFIVNTDSDKKFRKGDILKAAGWSTPARNKARGNVLNGGYTIRWTGPEYL